MSATENLTRALLGMAERGTRPRCGDGGSSHLWTSDAADDRKLAAAYCDGCPLTDLCAAVADEHRVTHGVWAGVDYSGMSLNRRKVQP